MRIEQQKVSIYGHRGAKKYAPENTIAAFQKALDVGADGFELDTMLSADGVPVVIHDRSLARTTNGIGFVDKKNVKELKLLDAGSWFSDTFHNERIPLLEEVLAQFGNQAQINIELKNFQNPFNQLPEKICIMIKKFDLSGSILFSSFIPFNLIRIRRIIPDAKVALLIEPDLLGRLLSLSFFRTLSPDFIHPHYSVCTEPFIASQHAMGRSVNTWTVNEIGMLKALISYGIDGIITDDPASAVSIRDKHI
jgi:glycerophosphoryl diester phosphodiesterase